MTEMNYILLTEQNDLPGIEHYAPFKVVLAIEDSVDQKRRDEISNWLVEAGARYAMTCGSDCKSWEQSIRQANLELFDIDNMEPKDFVMITTHEHERLRSVFWHAKKQARHTHVKIHNILTLHIGSQNRSIEYLAMFDKA